MTNKLFRQEAVDARHENWLGSVHLVSAGMGWPIAILGAVVVVVAIVFLIVGQFTESERVSGQLIPSDGLLGISAPVAGVVVDVMVVDGQKVSEGDPLLQISPEVHSPALVGGALGHALSLEMDRQHRLLKAELTELDREMARKRQGLENTAGSLEGKLEIIEAELTVRQSQLKSAETVLERIEPSRDSGQLSALQYHQYEDAVLEAGARVQLSRLQRADTLQQLVEIRNTLDQLPHQATQRRNEIERSLSELAQASAVNETRRTLVLRAPRDGQVSGIALSQGQAVSERQRLVSLIPDGSELLAELWAPSRAVGRLTSGGSVVLRYHAFPYQQYGQHQGRIVEIASSALTPEEVFSRTGLETAEPVFRVLVAVDGQQIRRGGQQYPLRSNMTLDADLVLGREPLYRTALAPAKRN